MSTTRRSAERIIVALDVENREKARGLVQALPDTEVFKIGLKLFTAEGPPLLRELQSLGKSVFLDLKLHDIPNTVAGAVAMAIGQGVKMMTLHACGGRDMLARAAQEASEQADRLGIPGPLLLAVTVLTSLRDPDLEDIGFRQGTADQVLRLARLAREAGVQGVVCSPLEISLIKREFGPDLTVVAPGIRPQWAAAQDQKRIMTPAQAVAEGADYIVIGRPVIAAPNPQAAFQRILEELE